MSITDSSTANTGASIGDVMTSSGSANTKGTWDEAIASTSEETYWVKLILSTPSGVTDENYLIDIGVGAAASEVVQIANIPIFINSIGQLELLMPITIASGARVAVRCQATAGAQSINYMLFLSNDDSFGTSTSNETWGALTASSKGTDVDPGGTDNTKGAYTELVASSGITTDYMILICGNSDNNGQVTQQYLLDVSTGAASSEVVSIGNMQFYSSGSERESSSFHFFNTIASGTRVAGRCQSNAAAAAGTNDRLIDMAIIAFDITPPAGGGGSGGIKLVGNGGGLVG